MHVDATSKVKCRSAAQTASVYHQRGMSEALIIPVLMRVFASPPYLCARQNSRILLLFLFLQSPKLLIMPANMDMNIDLDILSSEIDSAATTPGSVALESLNCQITENLNPEGEPQSECGSSELSSLDSALFPCTMVHQSQSSSLLSLRADREIPEIFNAKRKGRTSFVWEKQNGQEYLQDRKWQWKCVRCKISQPRAHA